MSILIQNEFCEIMFYQNEEDKLQKLLSDNYI